MPTYTYLQQKLPMLDFNKTGLQPVSRPVELVHYFGGWVEGASKRTDRTDGGLAQSTFGAKAANKTGGASRRQTPVLKSEKLKKNFAKKK